MTTIFDASELQRFAKIELRFDLTLQDAEHVSKLGHAHIRALLATIKHRTTANHPPFVVDDWRNMSAVRRRIFGHTRDIVVKRGNANVPTTVRECGVVNLPYTKYVGITHKRDAPAQGHKAIIFESSMWQAAMAKDPDDPERCRMLQKMASLFSSRVPKTVIKVVGQRIRDSVSGIKERQLRSLYEVTAADWPFVPHKGKTFWWNIVTGEELAQIVMLFGLNGQEHSDLFRKQLIEIRFIPDAKTLVFSNEHLSVVFTTANV